MLRDVKVSKNKTVNTFITVALVLLVVFAVVKIYKSTKAVGNVVGQAVGNETIATELGIKTDRVIYIRSEAEKLWNQGVQTHWYTLGIRDYDEQMFISVINGMTTVKEVGLLDQLYQESSGERLKDAINASFNDSDKSKLNPNWLAVINS